MTLYTIEEIKIKQRQYIDSRQFEKIISEKINKLIDKAIEENNICFYLTRDTIAVYEVDRVTQFLQKHGFIVKKHDRINKDHYEAYEEFDYLEVSWL